jgi:hypothetical protein
MQYQLTSNDIYRLFSGFIKQLYFEATEIGRVVTGLANKHEFIDPRLRATGVR